jgi:diamine N-acetyltransferase
MYGKDPDDGNMWIYVFMIDKKHQGHGHGTRALQKLIEHIKQTHQVNRILIGHKPENVIAGRLYEKVGFQDTGKRFHQEIVREYIFKPIRLQHNKYEGRGWIDEHFG